MPREVIVCDIPEHEKICGCGAHLVRIGEAITEANQIYSCKTQCGAVCSSEICLQTLPGKCKDNTHAEPAATKESCYTGVDCLHHYREILRSYPLYRQQNIWNRLGIDMPRSSLCGWLLKVSELIEPLVKLLRLHIIAYDYAQADETTVQVLDEMGRNNKTKSYIWCYRGGGVKPCIVYEYQETRAGYHAEKFLAGFKAICNLMLFWL